MADRYSVSIADRHYCVWRKLVMLEFIAGILSDFVRLDEKRWILLELVGKLVRMDVFLLELAGKLVRLDDFAGILSDLDGSWTFLMTSYPLLTFEVFSL